MKKRVGPVRTEDVLKRWGERVRKRKQSKVCTRKKVQYAMRRWVGFLAPLLSTEDGDMGTFLCRTRWWMHWRRMGPVLGGTIRTALSFRQVIDQPIGGS
jgi:hypothetical protein